MIPGCFREEGPDELRIVSHEDDPPAEPFLHDSRRRFCPGSSRVLLPEKHTVPNLVSEVCDLLSMSRWSLKKWWELSWIRGTAMGLAADVTMMILTGGSGSSTHAFTGDQLIPVKPSDLDLKTHNS